MKDAFEVATLETIAGGDAVSQMNFQIQNAIDNIRDPNTEPTAPRTISLKITLKPDNNREKVECKFQASAKLAPDAHGRDLLHLSRSAAYVSQARQMDFEELDPANVEHIDDAVGGKEGQS